MLRVTANGKNGSFKISLPTSLSEITYEYLQSVTEEIKVADNYALIGLCYHEALSTILFANSSKKKESTIQVVPIFIKSGKTDNSFMNDINCGEKLIISPSDIAMGHHVNATNNLITINNILRYADGDVELHKNAFKYNEQCYFLEFKIVPFCNIHGVYSNNVKKDFVSPFVTRVETEG